MSQRHVASLPILRDGDLVGIFTERDMLQRVVARGVDPATTAVSQVMTPSPITVDADLTGFEAVRTMHERGVRHLVVTGLGGTGYGIISIRDFPTSELATFEREIEFEERVWEER